MASNDNLVSHFRFGLFMGKGTLFVVATPIGNLEDISPRAARTLQEADLVVAEDTRHTRGLLRHLGLDASLRAMHEHNEQAVLPELLDRLDAGDRLALVSDAGTPLISDPGYRLVRGAHERGVAVCAIPGPSAVTAALSVSGLPTDRFVFEGFLPSRPGPRQQKLQTLGEEPRTVVVFEASHRIEACLADLEAVIGASRPMALCRELTKRFETVLHGTVATVRQQVAEDPNQTRGEFVIVIQGSVSREPELAQAVKLARELARELPASRAARVAARITGVSRRVLFDALEADPSRSGH